jgi:hypothetical protein
MKVIVKIPDDKHHWIARLLDKQNKKGFVEVRKVSTATFELIEEDMPRFLLSSAWIKEVIK